MTDAPDEIALPQAEAPAEIKLSGSAPPDEIKLSGGNSAPDEISLADPAPTKDPFVEQQPAFPGDPTGWLVNEAHKAASSIVDNGMAFLHGDDVTKDKMVYGGIHGAFSGALSVLKMVKSYSPEDLFNSITGKRSLAPQDTWAAAQTFGNDMTTALMKHTAEPFGGQVYSEDDPAVQAGGTIMQYADPRYGVALDALQEGSQWLKSHGFPNVAAVFDFSGQAAIAGHAASRTFEKTKPIISPEDAAAKYNLPAKQTAKPAAEVPTPPTEPPAPAAPAEVPKMTMVGHEAELRQAIDEIKLADPEVVERLSASVDKYHGDDPTTPSETPIEVKAMQVIQMREMLRLQKQLEQEMQLREIQGRDRFKMNQSDTDATRSAAEEWQKRQAEQGNSGGEALQPQPEQLQQAKGEPPADFAARLKAKRDAEAKAYQAKMDRRLADMAPPHEYNTGENVRLNDGRRLSIDQRTLNAEAAEPAYHGTIADPTTGMKVGHTTELGMGRPINEPDIQGRYTGPTQPQPYQLPQAKAEGGIIHNKGGILDPDFNANAPKGLKGQGLLNANPKKYAKLEEATKNYVPEGTENPTQVFVNNAPLNGTQMVAAWKKVYGSIADNWTLWLDQNNLRNIGHEILGGMTTSSYLAENGFWHNPESPFQQAFQWFVTRVRSARAEEHALVYEMKPNNDKYNAYYKIKTLTKFAIDLFKKDIAIRLKMEGGEGWFDGQNYRATVEQMMEHGMSRESAEIWSGIDANFDKIWNILQEAVSYADIKLPPRIPGYMPHVFKGQWRVLANIGENNTVLEYNYFTRKGRNQALAELQQVAKIRDDVTFEVRDPSAMGKQVADIVTGMQKLRATMGDNPAMNKFIAMMNDSSMRGIVEQVLERGTVTKGGHLLDRVNNEGSAGLSPAQIKSSAIMIERLQSDVVKYWRINKFLSEDYWPVAMSDMLVEGSNHADAIHHVINTYIGKETKWMQGVDNIVKDWMRKLGVDPQLLDPYAQVLKSGFGKYALSWKPPYWAINYFQKAWVVPTLKLEQAKAALAGERAGDIGAALRAATTDLLTPQGRAFRGRALEFAEKYGFADPRTLEQFDPGWGRDPIGVAIERNTRRSSFLISARYATSMGMDEASAFRWAGGHSERVAVPMDPRIGQPIAQTRLPTIIKPLFMFYSYGVHMLDQFEQGRSMIAEALYAKNPKAALKATAGVFQLALLGYGVGAVSGVVGSQLWDWITSIAAHYGNYLPDSHAVSRRLGVWAGKSLTDAGLPKGAADWAQDAMQFGPLSASIGYNVSGSGLAPDLNFGFFGATVLDTAWDALLLTTQYSLSEMAPKGSHWANAPSKDDWADIVSKMAPQWGHKLQFMLHHDLKDIPKLWSGDIQDYSIGRVNGHLQVDAKGMAITPRESLLDFWAGIKSNRVAAVDQVNREMSLKEEAHKTDLQQALKLIKQPGYPIEKKVQQLIRLRLQYYDDQDQMQSEMMEGMKNQILTDEQREAMGAASSQAAQKWYLERDKMLGQRGRK